MSVPVIRTAIPQRRYKLGDFIVTVLGDVESGDGVEYRWIMAVALESDPKPNLFISAERARAAGQGMLRLRVSMPDGEQGVGESERWSDQETFTREALALVSKMLDLGDEVPFRLD